MKFIAIRLILIYKKWFSPFLLPSCRFHPSCSQYALLAMERHGFFRAMGLVFLRLGKCHPWHEGGVDHVK